MRTLALLPLAALAACQPAAPDPRGVGRDETLLTVSATGKSEATPDEARITLGVETTAESAAEATRLNNEKMQKVIAALKGFGVQDKDLQTRTLGLNRVDYGKELGRYHAANQVEVRLHDMARVSEAIGAATTAGANLVNGPSLVVSDREAASKSAYAMAYKAARSRADAYADAAGLEVDRVLTIRDNGESGGFEPPMPMAVMEQAAPVAAPAPPPPPFNPGVNRTQVGVTVAFALKRK